MALSNDKKSYLNKFDVPFRFKLSINYKFKLLISFCLQIDAI